MMFYLTMFLGFVYIKIFRVRLELEKVSGLVMFEAVASIAAMLSLVIFGFVTLNWYVIILSAFLFFISAALMVAAVQLGMFVDGKPVLVMSQIYKFTPLLAFCVIAGTIITITL